MVKFIRTMWVVALVIVGFMGTIARAELNIYYEQLFDQMTIGSDLNGQEGWIAFPGRTIIGTAGNSSNPLVGVYISSRGRAFGFETLAESPRFAVIPPNSGEDFVMTVLVGFDTNRTGWYVSPKNHSANRVLTRIHFEAFGTLSVLVPDGQGGGQFVTVPDFTWVPNERYNLTMVFRRNGLFQLGINNRQLASFQSPAFAVGIEAVTFDTDNQRIDDRMFVDKIKIRRGHIGH